jgi:O-antigen/teichoic acid export membrane protein
MKEMNLTDERHFDSVAVSTGIATGDSQPLPAAPAGAPVFPGLPMKNLARAVFTNSFAQVAGRMLIALCRLVVASFIVRTYGKSMFGEYSLLFVLLSIADWLVDFGTTEVFVREVCRERDNEPRLLRVLTAVKVIQLPAAISILMAMMLALRYPARIVEAGLVGGLNLVFYAGVLIYRVNFKSTLTIEREVTAESLSVLAMVPMIALVCHYRGSLVALMLCHLISRAVFFGVCFLLGRKRFLPSLQGVTWYDVRWSFQSIAAIGVIGFLVGGYETIDILLLSKLGSFSELAYYSAAQRLVWPVLMALAAVGTTFYPVIASYWPHSRVKFDDACQRGLNTVLVLAGFALSALLAGAEFFIGLLGPDLVRGATALRVLALLCFVKAVTSTAGPVLYVVKAQKKALQFIAVALLVKTGVMAVLAPRFGYMGVAYGALAVEACFGAVPTIYFLQKLTGFHVQWTVPVKVVLGTLIAAAAPRLLGLHGLVDALVAPVIYGLMVFLTGAVRISEVRSALKWAP